MNNYNNENSPWIKGNKNKVDNLFQHYRIGTKKIFGSFEMIYNQNDLSSRFYYVKEGRIKVFILQEDGTERISTIQEPGSFFGETSAIDLLPRPCSAVALFRSELIELTQEDLVKLIQLDIEVCFIILQSLSQRVRLLSYQALDMSFLEAKQRIAHIILKLAADYGTLTSNGIELSIRLSDQELAGIVGLSRVTVTKALNAFKRSGLIEKEYRKIIIKNLSGLQKQHHSVEGKSLGGKPVKSIES